MTELVEWLRHVAPRHKEGTARGFAFNMDGLCLQELNAKINEAADRIEAQEREIAELRVENDRLRANATSARAASKRAGRDLLREEADAILPHFGDDWEPLRYVALRSGSQSAAWLASRARNLQGRGLVESQWIGNDRTSSFKVWRKALGGAE